MLPLGLAAFTETLLRPEELAEPGVLRLLLTSGMALKFPSLEVREAAQAAAKFAMDAPRGSMDPAFVHAAVRAAEAAANITPDETTRFASNAVKSAGEVANADLGSYWAMIHEDCEALTGGQDLLHLPLWSVPAPAGVILLWTTVRARWAEQGGPARDFWTGWYEAALAGREQKWVLLHDIAVMGHVDWLRGLDWANAGIAGNIVEYERAGESAAKERLDQLMQRYSITATEIAEQVAQNADFLGNAVDRAGSVSTMRKAILVHRQALPPTFEAVLSFVELEVARLQGRNYHDADDAEEAHRQIRVLTILHEAVTQMRALIPTNGAIPQVVAEEVEKLSRVYQHAFQEWPRTNAADLADSTYRGALIGATAVLLPLLGVSPSVAVAAGCVVFGGKKLADGIKAAKDVIGIGSPGG
jgi:hypothetical protein